MVHIYISFKGTGLKGIKGSTTRLLGLAMEFPPEDLAFDELKLNLQTFII